LWSLRRRGNDDTANHLAGAQIVERGVYLRQWPCRDRDIRCAGLLHQLQELTRIVETADIAALDGERPDREKGSRHDHIAAEQADHDTLPALDRRIDRQLHWGACPDKVDRRPGTKPAGRSPDLVQRILGPAIDHDFRAGLLRRLALHWIDI